MASLRRTTRSPQRRGISLRAALLSTTLFDELTIGMLIIGLPLVRDRLQLSYAQVGLLFTVGSLSSLITEPLINLLADRGSKRWPVVAGMLGLIAGFALAGAAPSFLWLLLAFVLIWPAIGAAVGLAQAALIDLEPGLAAVAMTRWALSSAIGDLLAPAAVALLTGVGLHWPALCAVAAACWLLALGAVAPQRFPTPGENLPDEDGDGQSTLTALRAAIGDRALLRWAGVEVCAVMLDEVFVGFAALYLRDALGATPGQIGLLLLPGAFGAMFGLLVLERVLTRRSGTGLLPIMALLALAGVVALLLAPSLWVAGAALAIIGLGAAGWYPIARAAAFDRYPGRPGLVRTVLGVTEPAELALPGAIGLISTQLGIRAGVAVLGLAPLIVLLLVVPRLPRLSGQLRR